MRTALALTAAVGLPLVCGGDDDDDEVTVSVNPRPATVASTDPLSSLVAIRLTDAGATGADNIADYIKVLVDDFARTGQQPLGGAFPLENATTDTVRTLAGLDHNVVIGWLAPLTTDNGPDAPRYGANNDYVAYFGEGWDSDWNNGVVGSAPQFNGSGAAGWIWSNR